MPTTNFNTTSGKFARAVIAGGPMIGMQKWSCTLRVDELDATDAESDGIENMDAGVLGADVDVEGLWRITQGPFPLLRPGTILTDVELFPNRNAPAARHRFTRMLVVRTPTTVEVRGQIKWTTSVKIAIGGDYIAPTE